MNVHLLTPDDKTIRTQITLTTHLKALIEQQAAHQGISLSEYLRQAALTKYQLEKQEKIDRKKLAEKLLGSINLKKHPEWSNSRKIYQWSRNIRKEWAR